MHHRPHSVLLVIAWIWIAFSISVSGQRVDSVFQLSAATDRPVLLVFSGSDWCLPCRKLHQEVLDGEKFRDFAGKNLVLLEADFPQRKKQSRSLIRENESLAERYNPQGNFPFLVLLASDGTVLKVPEIREQTPASLIGQLEAFVPGEPALRVFQHRVLLMGSAFEFKLVAPSGEKDRAWALLREAEAEVRRIEQLISSWDPASQTSAINRAAGRKAIKVDPELLGLIRRANHLSALSQGAFDITFAALDRFWVFDGREAELPAPDSLRQYLDRIGYEKVQLDERAGAVFLPQPAMKIGFGGIGKGYAADRVRRLWQAKGVHSGLVNAGGDLLAWGQRPDGGPWKVGIADPRDPGKMVAWLAARDQAIATSGDYERYLLIAGERYGHIIDPRTGYPAKGVKSVTIIAPSGEMADALASAVFVLGPDVGLDLVNQLPKVECLLIDSRNEIHTTLNLQIEQSNAPGRK